MTTTELIPFHGDELVVVLDDDAQFIAVRPICDRLGIDDRVQIRKLKARPELWGAVIMTAPSAGGDQDTLCLPVNRLAAWLFSINPGKVSGQFRDALIRYQIEAADALDAHFRQRRAMRAEHVASLEEQASLAASTLLSAQPMWNKIARLQEAGVVRGDIRHHINRSEAATEAILNLMERSGAIDWTLWAGWRTALRHRLAKADLYSRAFFRQRLDAGEYTGTDAERMSEMLSEPMEVRG